MYKVAFAYTLARFAIVMMLNKAYKPFSFCEHLISQSKMVPELLWPPGALPPLGSGAERFLHYFLAMDVLCPSSGKSIG